MRVDCRSGGGASGGLGDSWWYSSANVRHVFISFFLIYPPGTIYLQALDNRNDRNSTRHLAVYAGELAAS